VYFGELTVNSLFNLRRGAYWLAVLLREVSKRGNNTHFEI